MCGKKCTCSRCVGEIVDCPICGCGTWEKDLPKHKAHIAYSLYMEWDKYKEKEARNSLSPYPKFFLDWLENIYV